MKLRIFKQWALMSVFCFTCFIGYTQISINEYSASNLRSFRDNYDDTNDWIELYNSSNTDVDLGGYHLSDKLTKPTKWTFPANSIIASKGFLIVWASGRDEVSEGHYHTNFKFTQTKNDEFVVLTAPNGSIIESSPVKITQSGHSVCKPQDGGSTWRIAKSPSFNTTNNETRTYADYAPSPQLLTATGAIAGDTVTVVVNNDSNYITRFTIDGRVPHTSSPQYLTPRKYTKTTVINVRNFPKDTTEILPSFVTFGTFFIKEPSTTLPIISLVGDRLTDLANGDKELRPIGFIQLFDKDFKLTSSSYGEIDSHGQDSWVNDQRSLDWVSRDEMGFNNALDQKIFNYSDRDSYQRLILRASGDDNYPATNGPEHDGSTHVRDEFVHTMVQRSGMHMDVRAMERYIVYVNGKYWGVYTVREKPDDHDYIEHTYDQGKYDIQFMKTWGNSWVEYGGDQAIKDWVEFRDSVLNNDISSQEMQKYIDDNMDVTSLFDYMIANLSAVSSDWLNYNTGWWRGLDEKGKHKKWGYIMWDNDATFDYYINYSGVPNTDPDAQACDINDIASYMDEFFPIDTIVEFFEADSFFIDGEWLYLPADTFVFAPDLGKHEKLFLKLIEQNQKFRNDYFQRYTDMNNTIYNCTTMRKVLDSLVAIIEPEMPRHISRWSGTMTEWRKNVDKLREFVDQRCALLNNGLVNCYSLSGPHQITVMTNPPNSGEIRFNTVRHQQLPWTGEYLGNMENEVKVFPAAGKQFLRWESKNGATTIEDPQKTETDFMLTARDTLIAIFVGATGTEDLEIEMLTSYPNPAQDYIKVSFPNEVPSSVDIEIIDLMGRVVYGGVSYPSGGVVQINTSLLADGQYTLRSAQKDKIYQSKFAIIR
jgi:hypothetical protein